MCRRYPVNRKVKGRPKAPCRGRSGAGNGLRALLAQARKQMSDWLSTHKILRIRRVTCIDTREFDLVLLSLPHHFNLLSAQLLSSISRWLIQFQYVASAVAVAAATTAGSFKRHFIRFTFYDFNGWWQFQLHKCHCRHSCCLLPLGYFSICCCSVFLFFFERTQLIDLICSQCQANFCPGN